jgi:hypothetical protein
MTDSGSGETLGINSALLKVGSSGNLLVIHTPMSASAKQKRGSHGKNLTLR